MKRKYSRIIGKAARQNGVSAEVVYCEIQKAIETGYGNPDPAVQAYWSKIAPGGGILSPERLIEVLANEMKK